MKLIFIIILIIILIRNVNNGTFIYIYYDTFFYILNV